MASSTAMLFGLPGGGSSRAWTILNQAMLGSYSAQLSLPVAGSVTLCLSICLSPIAMAMATSANLPSSCSSSIRCSMASLIRLPRE